MTYPKARHPSQWSCDWEWISRQRKTWALDRKRTLRPGSAHSKRYKNRIADITVISGFETKARLMGHFPIELTQQPRLHAALNKRCFACGLNCNNSYWCIIAIGHWITKACSKWTERKKGGIVQMTHWPNAIRVAGEDRNTVQGLDLWNPNEGRHRTENLT